MLTAKIEKALNKQIQLEAESSFTYLAMASWADANGYENSAQFLYAQSAEERDHMLRLFTYINDAGGRALAPNVKVKNDDHESLEKLFIATLENEQKVTEAINNLVDLCLKERDHSTHNFLQWYVAEQHEEEKSFRSILDLFKLMGTDRHSLYHLDKEIGNRIGGDGEPENGQI